MALDNWAQLDNNNHFDSLANALNAIFLGKVYLTLGGLVSSSFSTRFLVYRISHVLIYNLS